MGDIISGNFVLPGIGGGSGGYVVYGHNEIRGNNRNVMSLFKFNTSGSIERVTSAIGGTNITEGTSTKAYKHYGTTVPTNSSYKTRSTDCVIKHWKDVIGPIFNKVIEFKSLIICANSSGIYYSTDNGSSVTKSNISNVSIKEFINVGDVGLLALTTSNTSYFTSDGKSWVTSNLNNDIVVNTECEQGVKFTDGTLVYGLGIADWSESHNENYVETEYHWEAAVLTLVPIPIPVQVTKTRTVTNHYTSSQIGISTDYGKTWTIKNLPGNTTLNKIFYAKISNKDIYVAGTSNGLMYSENPANGWTQSNIKTGNFDFVKAVTFAGVTTFYASDGNGLQVSTDGKTWTKDSVIPSNVKISGAEVLRSRVVFVSSNGDIYYKGTLSGYFK